jgi:hypothetical protein
MLDYIKKLIADYQVAHPGALPDIYVGTQRGYVAGKPIDVETYPTVAVIATSAGTSVGVLVSNILFVSSTEPEMESAGL